MKAQLKHCQKSLREKQEQIDRLVKDNKRQDKEHRNNVNKAEDKVRQLEYQLYEYKSQIGTYEQMHGVIE